MKISHLILASGLSLICIQTNAGFADTMRDLRSTLSQFNETSKEVSNTAREWTGNRANNTSNYTNSSLTVGQQLRPNCQKVRILFLLVMRPNQV